MKPHIAEACISRAAGKCEACGEPLAMWPPELVGELDHAEGRAVSEEVDTVWVLHRKCHQQRHASIPSKAEWLQRWADFCASHGYRDSYSRAFEKLRWAEQKSAFGKGAA